MNVGIYSAQIDSKAELFSPNGDYTDLTSLWLGRVNAHKFGTFDSLTSLRHLRERADLIPPEQYECIQPVIDALDEIFQTNRLSSPKLEPALKEASKRLGELKEKTHPLSAATAPLR